MSRPQSPPFRAVKFRQRDAFQGYVRARVERYLRMTGRRRTGGVPILIKTIIILLWLAASYTALVFFAPNWYTVALSAIALGLALAAVGFNIQHDGGHRSYAARRWVNRMMAMTLDLVGGSSYVWNIKHNKLHHTYTNIAGHDDDINLGALARLSPDQRRHWFHRFQHYYLWPCYAAVAVKWHLYDDFRNVLCGKIGSYKFDRPTGWELVAFISGKAVLAFLAFVLPALFHPLWIVAVGYLATMGLCGIVMSIIFQLAHVVQPAAYPQPDPVTGEIRDSWAAHQMETSVDFAQKNPVLTWLLGGLNFQAEHHLLPHISHRHYPRLAPLVAHACHRFDIPYHVHRTFLDGLISHFRQLRTLGRARPPLTA